jgi:hypothetical protein
MHRMPARVLIAAAAALLLVVPTASAADRYSLVHGCYALQTTDGKFVAKSEGGGYTASADAASAGEAIRMQATRLGEYLFFGKAGDFVAADDGGAVVTATAPSANAEWRVEELGKAFKITLPAQERALAVGDGGALTLAAAPSAFRFAKTTGCATYPEAEVNVTGQPHTGSAPWAETRGFIDPHFHWMAFEFIGGRFHCGRPWHEYGIASALVDCPDHEPDGAAAVNEAVFSNGSVDGRHDTHGWPTFVGWPKAASLTHEGSYYKWIERAWRSGLRMTTVLLVDNAVLCEVYPYKRNSCDEMENIRLQARDMHELEEYVDAQSGGPGKGWLRIVKDPFEARRVINQGKLAVVLGIESSRLFQCRELNGNYECDTSSIDQGLDEVYDMGVRQMEIVNKFDNALTGVAGDSGNAGLVVNQGNKIETGHYWRMKTCQNLPEDVHDKTQPTAPAPGQITSDPAFSGVIDNYLPTGQTPVYPPGPHCNEAGLTPLGAHLIERMIDKGMLFDPDHMSVKARLQALDIVEQHQYSGILSSHSWSTPDAYPRIYKLGGIVTPITGRSEGFVQEWRTLKPQAAPKFYFGFGFGSDQNGLHSEPPARNPEPAKAVTYPFKTWDGGSTVERNKAGEKTWDVNTEGWAHYGLMGDWIEDLRKVGGDAIVEDMARGSEAFLQMWERAEGVDGDECVPKKAKFTRRGLGALRLGASAKALVKAAGQPEARTRRGFEFCVAGTQRTVEAGLGRKGRLRVIGTTARGHRAGGVRPGDRRPGKGLVVRRAGAKRSFVYGVRNGRVRFVGLAPAKLAGRPAALQRAVRAAGLR